MTKSFTRFITIATLVAGLHFGAVLSLGIVQARVLSRILDGTYKGSSQGLLLPERVSRVLTFPVMQTVGRPRAVGTTPTYVVPLTQVLIPLTSVFWGVAVAALLGRRRNRQGDVEQSTGE